MSQTTGLGREAVSSPKPWAPARTLSCSWGGHILVGRALHGNVVCEFRTKQCYNLHIQMFPLCHSPLGIQKEKEHFPFEDFSIALPFLHPPTHISISLDRVKVGGRGGGVVLNARSQSAPQLDSVLPDPTLISSPPPLAAISKSKP